VTVVCRLEDIEPGAARKVDVDGIAVAVVRIGGDVHAIADTCSHANVSLSEGIVLCESRSIECIRHGSAFNLETGHPDTLPATQPVEVFDAEVRDGNVIVTRRNPR
jgi:3-phenylpropionate/trans-cinnamate dioxygenase ferredoxin subunit